MLFFVMKSFDTNLAVYALNPRMPQHQRARAFLESLREDHEVAVCELMLVELFLKLCNQRIFPKPLQPNQARDVCLQFRNNAQWMLIENADVMEQVWDYPQSKGFAFRKIIDIRLALTLQKHGVTHFATTNVKDFQGLGFEKVWNPLKEESEL